MYLFNVISMDIDAVYELFYVDSGMLFGKNTKLNLEVSLSLKNSAIIALSQLVN